MCNAPGVNSDPLAHIPPPAEKRLALRVTPAAQRALRQGHPWVFDGAITAQSAEGQPGDLAVIFDDRRRFLAIGLYDPTSPIRVRVLQHGAPQVIDGGWLRERLAAASALRVTLPSTGTTGYRLVHGENDGLGGLVIDRYADTLVVKLYTPAWIPRLSDLRAALQEIQAGARVVLRLSRHVQQAVPTGAAVPCCGLANGTVLSGTPLTLPVLFSENGLYFEADVLFGQKTGFFLDQRDNRARVGDLARGKRTLDVFACSGGFSLYAARGGAPEVLSVDASAGALAAAERHFTLNRHVPAIATARHAVQVADAFAALAALQRRGQRFELVIVDPPAFAKRASEVDRALRAYTRLTALALGVLAPGGTLVMASCSSRVSAIDFFAAVHRAAVQAGRPLVESARTGHALDHPVRFPEGAYLKCLFATA